LGGCKEMLSFVVMEEAENGSRQVRKIEQVRSFVWIRVGIRTSVILSMLMLLGKFGRLIKGVLSANALAQIGFAQPALAMVKPTRVLRPGLPGSSGCSI
jgi:hypothetical protein